MIEFEAYIFHVNREDLLQKAIRSMQDVRKNLTIVDNSEDGTSVTVPPPTRIVRPSVPLSSSQSFNWAMKDARVRGCRFIMIMHEDAEAGPQTASMLVEMAQDLTEQGKKWGVIFTNYDCLAALNLDMLDDVGLWDTVLPQYYCDNDYYRRARLAGYEMIESHLPVLHVGSQTIRSEPHRQLLNSITFPMYGGYYAAKWGGSPGNETYSTPFNR